MFDRPADIAARLKAPLVVAGTVLACWLLLQALMFRSGAYWRAAEPDSNAGAVTHALLLLQAAQREGRRTVLVLGDSRVGEGFSGPLATRAGDVDFINLSVPGSTPRTWYYLLREIDRRGHRYDAVVIGMLYASEDRIRTADWPLDPLHQVALVGLRDVFAYPGQAGAGTPRRRAWHALLFPALTAQQDLRALLAAPLERWQRLRQRSQYIADTIAYAGREERLPGDYAPPPAAPIPAHIAQANAQYQARWIGALSHRAAARGAPTLVFPLPRGPRAGAVPETPRWSGATVLPADLFVTLESPEFFFDALHVNRQGREQMSAAIGERVRTELR